jgi:hypothetical protein
MAIPILSPQSQFNQDDAAIWQSLQQAISNSSGFQRWQQEKTDAHRDSMTLEQQVRLYLRETLATLAY